MTSVLERVRDADGSDVAEGAGRAGLVARGVVYLVVAALGVQVALGSTSDGEQADQRGALTEIAEQSYGSVLLVLLAAGFGCYAAWRLVRALRGEGRDEPDARSRATDVGRAVLHLGLLASTVSILAGGGSDEAGGSGGSGGGGSAQTWTAQLMATGWGRWLVGLLGVVIVAGGAWLVTRGFGEKFRENLERHTRWVVALGKVGHVGRGVAFALIGAFLARAAWQFDPNEPIGLDAALHDLARSGWGTVAALAVSLALAAFGLFCVAEARDRRVLDD